MNMLSPSIGSGMAEEWYERHLKKIRSGQVTIMTNNDWRSAIKFNREAARLCVSNDELSSEYLASLLGWLFLAMFTTYSITVVAACTYCMSYLNLQSLCRSERPEVETPGPSVPLWSSGAVFFSFVPVRPWGSLCGRVRWGLARSLAAVADLARLLLGGILFFVSPNQRWRIEELIFTVKLNQQ